MCVCVHILQVILNVNSEKELLLFTAVVIFQLMDVNVVGFVTQSVLSITQAGYE